MNIHELVEAVGGEIVRGRARYKPGKEWVLLAKIEGGEMVPTEAGRQLLREKEAELSPAKSRRGKSPSAGLAELSTLDGPVATD